MVLLFAVDGGRCKGSGGQCHNGHALQQTAVHAAAAGEGQAEEIRISNFHADLGPDGQIRLLLFGLGHRLQAAACGHNGAGGACVTAVTRGHINAVIARFLVWGHLGGVQQVPLVIFQRDDGQGVAGLIAVDDGKFVLYRVLGVAKGCLGLRQGVGARRKVGQCEFS